MASSADLLDLNALDVVGSHPSHPSSKAGEPVFQISLDKDGCHREEVI